MTQEVNLSAVTTIGWEVAQAAPTRKLAIVGSHPATRELAPYDDESWEIWLFNEAAQKPSVYRRWDGLLQMHKREVYESLENWVNKEHWSWLQQDHGETIYGRKRIFMHEVDERVPNSVRYPLEGVLSLIPFHYLRSSPALALGLAIYLGYKTIALYGSDLTSNTEYHYQAINLAFWIGYALGHGIDLQLECWHSEFNQPIYGYEGEPQLSPDYYLERAKLHEQEWQVRRRGYEKLLDYMVDAQIESKFDKVAELSLQLEEVLMATGESYGRMQEARRYYERKDHISRQEFERVAAYAQQEGEKQEKQTAHEGGKCEYVWNVWKQTGRMDALGQLRTFLKQKSDYAYETGRQLGIFRENIEYQNEYDKLVQALGGERAVRQITGGANG